MATITPVWSYGVSVIRHTESVSPGDETPIWSYGTVVLAEQTDAEDTTRRISRWLTTFIARGRHRN